MSNLRDFNEMVKKGMYSVRSNLESTDPRIAEESRKALREHDTWLQDKREEIRGVIEAYQKLLGDSDANNKTLSVKGKSDDEPFRSSEVEGVCD